MDFSFIGVYKNLYLAGALETLRISLITVILGSILGMFLSLMRLSKWTILKFLASAYIEFIRGTPIMVQIFLINYGLPYMLGIEIPTFIAGIIALSINSSAYVAEIFRAGIQAVDRGQMEAARSLGMPHSMAMRHIILPQALRNILPALGNEFVVVIKESSIVSLIGIAELMKSTDIVRANTYLPFEPLIIAALIYFVMTFTLSKLLGIAERRMKAGA